MTIECSFCSTSKSERYLYTECGHLVCINCASLRASENLQCCNVATKLEEEVKSLLKEKKDKIMNNLENKYKYEKSEVNRMGFTELQERLKKLDNMESRPRRKFQEDFEPEEKEMPTAEDQELKETPINQFYKNPFSEQYKGVILQSTPIKMVSARLYENQKELEQEEVDSFNPLSHKKQPINQKSPTKKRENQAKVHEFNSVLHKSILSVKQEFKGMHEQLEKIEANLLYQMEVYFEEYVNLIEKENVQTTSFSEVVKLETGRIHNFLDQFVQQWSLKDIFRVLSEKESIKKSSNFVRNCSRQTDSEINNKRKIIYSNLIEPLRNDCIKRPLNLRKNEKRDEFLDKIRLSESNQAENKLEPVQYSGRNLNRIYKKLEQSRNKLEQRIQIHNEFMSRRCLKLGSY